MTGPAAVTSDCGQASPGRPAEIELWSNRRLIHPLSRRLVELLLPTRISPDAVSGAGVVMAALAALAYTLLPWPGLAFIGLAFHIAWHVFDGADGELARRTGRASANGELVDGICDHLGQGCLYVAFAIELSDDLGLWAWALGAGAAASRAVQANAYETCRRNYRRWVYGAGWLRQTLEDEATTRPAGLLQRLQIGLGHAYLAVSERVSRQDLAVEAAMSRLTSRGAKARGASVSAYQAEMLPAVKQAGWLSANLRTIVTFVSLLAGSPLYVFVWELVVLNLVMAVLAARRARADRVLLARLKLIEHEL